MSISVTHPIDLCQARRPHHLLDLVNPGDPFTLSQYQELAYAAIAGIQAHGRLPFLVGGSGLYVRAVLDGLVIPQVAPNPERRAERFGEIPLGRIATTADVANAFVFLASDEASFINGVAFPVDGGLTAY